MTASPRRISIVMLSDGVLICPRPAGVHQKQNAMIGCA